MWFKVCTAEIDLFSLFVEMKNYKPFDKTPKKKMDRIVWVGKITAYTIYHKFKSVRCYGLCAI